MDIAQGLGSTARTAVYTVPDDQLAVGSTLGSPTLLTIIKATGAIEKVYHIASGRVVFGTLVLHHWDERSGMHLAPSHPGTFTIHPEHQQHAFTLPNGIAVDEDVFVLSGLPGADGAVDPPAMYYTVELRNESEEEVRIGTYAFCLLRGDTGHDVAAAYDPDLGALVAWNAADPGLARAFGCSERPTGFETSLDYAKAVSMHSPGRLSGKADAPPSDPLGVLHHSHTLAPGQRVRFAYLLCVSDAGQQGALATYHGCPTAEAALARTKDHYRDVLSRSVLLSPNPQVNRGVLWAKANMLRVESKAPTGWCFTNDPTRSTNSVGRDTAWFAFGADYLTPEFARESLRAYLRLQEDSGKIIEYYDIRTNKTEDYNLNINDNTPLLILALWHHYAATGDEGFLRESYPAAVKAANYILSQRNTQGLVWCTATDSSDWGIVGWRNVIPNYRLSGASTEVNAESYAALHTIARIARALGEHEQGETFAAEAGALKEAINTHLANPDNGLYYLHIDLDGTPRSDVTSDLVFPVIFGVASEETAARIISRLSAEDFWTDAGMRTTPRDSPTYTPDGGWGLLGGVWVGVSFWYAFAAAPYNPAFMDYALGTSFQNYSRNPRRNNTVPGQFSEWLHGETLVNQGMMLSPWFPPRYLWAAIEGAGGLDLSTGVPRLRPKLAPDWQWLAVQRLPLRGGHATWLLVRTPELALYTTFAFEDTAVAARYEADITEQVQVVGGEAAALGMRRGGDLLLFVGNTGDHTITTSVRLDRPAPGSYRCRSYDSLLGRWEDAGSLQAERLDLGIAMQVERKGFWLLELTGEGRDG